MFSCKKEHIHLEAHLNMRKDLSLSESQAIRHNVETVLRDQFGISHITLQIEYKGCENNNELIFN